MNLAILASGKGTLIPAISERVPVSMVIADRHCEALKVGEDFGLHTLLMPKKEYKDALEFDLNLLVQLGEFEIGGLICAGYKSILSKVVCTTYSELILNCHPSLLPKFPGLNALQRSMEAIAKTGFTIHTVVEEVDAGRILYQEEVAGSMRDTVGERQTLLQSREKIMYPEIILQHFFKTPPS